LKKQLIRRFFSGITQIFFNSPENFVTLSLTRKKRVDQQVEGWRKQHTLQQCKIKMQ